MYPVYWLPTLQVQSEKFLPLTYQVPSPVGATAAGLDISATFNGFFSGRRFQPCLLFEAEAGLNRWLARFTAAEVLVTDPADA